MKLTTAFLSAIAAAAIISGTGVLLLTPEGWTEARRIQSFWATSRHEQPTQVAVQAPRIFAQLNVVDDTRSALSLDEQKALFTGLADVLRDATSAQVRRLKRTTDSKFGLCGEVNSKNGYGGYTGFSPFAGVLKGETAEILVFDRKVVEQKPEEMRVLLAKWGCSLILPKGPEVQILQLLKPPRAK